MKSAVKTWFVGCLILSPAALFVGAESLMADIEAESFTGSYRPVWWRVVSITVFVTVWVVIPLIAVFNAKQYLNALAKPKDDPDHYSAVIADIEKEKKGA